jgi:hypothetical protein
MNATRLVWIATCLASVAWPATALAAAAPDFNREVRPILSRYCFKCHGPDDAQRQAGLRLDGFEGATAALESGAHAIVPGRPEASELVRRIDAADPAERMPPAETNRALSAEQKETLRRWIAAGAEYQPHWAFVPPHQAPLPAISQAQWPANPIDCFILARLEAAGLKPAPPADRYALVRRVYLDLIGMPPTPEEAEAFAADESPDAYERLVDRLLANPHYGERWARRWLDLARYADTNGYEKDRARSIWPYRDWVIAALNADLPFDEFTVQQLAGDMLPGATLDQRIATGFHRNTMLNEEGGIDPLEFRFHAVVDRVSTTGTVWLGLTVGCAQCHTHKFDPIAHTEYYRFLALLNNAEEPQIDVPDPAVEARRQALLADLAAREADLASQFPPAGDVDWHVPLAASAVSTEGATIDRQDDGSLLASGANPERDVYTIAFESDAAGAGLLRLETLTHPSLGGQGPGRTPHGNFVLSEVSVTAAPLDAPDQAVAVALSQPAADVAQENFPIEHALDGNPATGWAIYREGEKWNADHAATFAIDSRPAHAGGTRWTVRLEQAHGQQHTLGRFRISLGVPRHDDRPLEERRRENLAQRFAQWSTDAAAGASRWTVLRPSAATSTLAYLEIEPDGSVLAGGDQGKHDEYELTLPDAPAGITALRLEAMADERLPGDGPGRVYYEGEPGDFFLSRVELLADGRPIALADAAQSFAAGGDTAATALDDNVQTGWSIRGATGQTHAAVFRLAEPLAASGELRLRLLCSRYYASGLGRFRVSVTTDPRATAAPVLPAGVEQTLLVPEDARTSDQRELLLRHFLSIAPELAAERQAIAQLRAQLPRHPTTLVMEERPAEHPRSTHRHHRGEFLQAKEEVEPGVFSILPTLAASRESRAEGQGPGAESVPGASGPRPSTLNTQPSRLDLARWLVDPAHPLTARVTVNRQWAAFFGRGIVKTTEDFGYQGSPPTHPELLDWLAVELVRQGWSLKKLHRLIVTSATYRQSARVSPEALARDVDNALLSRAPRLRLEAEVLRDTVLAASGLLTERLGGPSVFPPQPASVTTEGAYGGLAWTVSPGGDRYRRGLYTFSKRTAPFAAFTTFDAPSGEACVARREVSNTPLQALTLLNDEVFVEAAQALGRAMVRDSESIAARQPDREPLDAQVAYLFARCLSRPPTDAEREMLVDYYRRQLGRFAAGDLDAAAVAGAGAGDAAQRAAWTVLARALLNVDEAVTKP